MTVLSRNSGVSIRKQMIRICSISVGNNDSGARQRCGRRRRYTFIVVWITRQTFSFAFIESICNLASASCVSKIDWLVDSVTAFGALTAGLLLINLKNI